MPARRPPAAPSSEPESASDKENTPANTQRPGRPNTSRKMHGKSTQGTQGTQKRRRDEDDGRNFYDPDQPAQERRAIAKQQRVLRQRMNDAHTELTKPEDDSMLEILKENEGVFKNVKQTNDALHDAQFIVKAAETAAKRMANFRLGGAAAATIDPSDFLTRLLNFSKGSPEYVDEENQELDWTWIGRETYSMHRRAPTTDFLLGPLSLVKKKRTAPRTQRNRLAIREEDKARPQQLNLEDVKKQENKVPSLVVSVKRNLEDFILDHGDDEGFVDYLRFITNPRDFGQTVENMFYVSFLIKDGHAGIQNSKKDGRVLLGIIEASEEPDAEEDSEPKVRRQMISSITMSQWKKTIGLFGITESAIEHRENVDDTPTSWAATQA